MQTGTVDTLIGVATTNLHLKQSGRIKADVALKLIDMVLGDNDSHRLRPAMQTTIDFSALETMEDNREAERQFSLAD